MEAEDQTFTDTKLDDRQMGHVGAITWHVNCTPVSQLEAEKF